MKTYPRSQEILNANRRVIPGGVVSVNRAVTPEIVFVRADGATLYDGDGTSTSITMPPSRLISSTQSSRCFAMGPAGAILSGLRIGVLV